VRSVIRIQQEIVQVDAGGVKLFSDVISCAVGVVANSSAISIYLTALEG